VTLDAAEGVFEVTMSRDVWVTSGAITVDDVDVSPGTRVVEVPISTRTSVPVDYMDLPLQWDNPADLTLDSVSTVGLRAESFPAPQWRDLDVENGRGCLRVWTVDSLAMAPGEGELLALVFSVDPEPSAAHSTIRLAEHGSCRMRFVTDRGPYHPRVTNGSVEICEPPNCRDTVSVRRSPGRRHP
jgi:hypothetical protein